MSFFTTSPLVKTYSLEEFWALPEPVDGSKLELIAGVLYVSPQPRGCHTLVATNLNMQLHTHLIKTKTGGAVFTPRAVLWNESATSLEPDLFYLGEALLGTYHYDNPKTAGLVFEIVFPATEIYAYRTKADTYAALGVRELWLIEPERTRIEVRYLNPTTRAYEDTAVFQCEDAVQSRVLPRFTTNASELCQDWRQNR